MGSHGGREAFTFRTNPRPIWTVIKIVVALSLVGAVFIGIAMAIGWALGVPDVQERARLPAAAWMLATLYFAWRAVWNRQLVFRLVDGVITARYGFGRVRGRATRLHVHKPMEIMLGKAHGPRPLTLAQDGMVVHLGLDVDVFPHPYLELVAWIRAQGVHLIELVTYTETPATPRKGRRPRRRGSVVWSARRRRAAP